MKKKVMYPIYLTEKDNKKLIELSQKRNESKSAVVRKLINSEKYMLSLKQLEINNALTNEILYELKKYGANLNQIAYHLNINLSSKQEARTKLEEIFSSFILNIENYAQKIKSSKINIGVNHIKAPKKAQEQTQEESENGN